MLSLLWARRYRALPVSLFVCGHLAYVVLAGGDWMPFGRFVLPVVPLMVILAVAGAYALVDSLPKSAKIAKSGVFVVAAAALGVMALGLDHRVANSPEEDSKLPGMKGRPITCMR